MGNCFVIFLLGIFLAQPHPQPNKPETDYKQIFAYAERLSNSVNPTDSSDSLALRSYQKVIRILSETKKNDVFLFKVYVSTGSFCQVLEKQNQAIPYFLKAIELKKKLPQMEDSVLFRPLVYAGNGYYMTDNLGTAESYYKKAEAVAEKYPRIDELERLYNTLGVISYSTGNYSKSLTYYQKAISTLTERPSFDTLFLVTYKNNLASSYKKLKRYNEALNLYRSVLPYNIEIDKLYHNIGSAYIQMGESEKAIAYLKKVKYEDQKKLNDLGLAFYRLRNYNQAGYYLKKADELNLKVNGKHLNSNYGLTLKYLGDISFQKKEAKKALLYYQKSIQNFLSTFHPQNLYANPTDFSSVFNGVDLLETLIAKASALKLLYAQTNQVKNLDASLQTYLAFYKLADHMERVYDMDESRLLMNDRKYASHQTPIDLCLDLYKITGDKKYKEMAFYLDEENKANTLLLYREESELKVSSGIPVSFLKQETALRESITQISLTASGETDRAILDQLQKRLQDQTINLLKLQQKINDHPGYSQFKFSKKSIPVQSLQRIIPSKSAILSYHIGKSNILCFIITDKKFVIFTVPLSKQFLISVKNLYNLVQLREGNNGQKIRNISRYLYKQLIRPAETSLLEKEDIMVIPDDELNYLPFELLMNEQGETLMSRYSITYNYSCTLLDKPKQAASEISVNTLAMAPFYKIDPGVAQSLNELNSLPASAKEIENLTGTSLLNQDATKQRFLKDAAHFSIIHLATHAYANDEDPAKSYIAFYPQYADSAISYRLYIPEINNLKLDETRLVILSACQSGAGELVKGEGLMSLSRAFSYAGCPNIITSMWKADDNSTAYIASKLHIYLQKGYRISEALQKSKLDYLNDEDVASRQKLPGYYAHLRLIGNFEKDAERPSYPALILIFIVLIFAGVLVLVFKKKDRFKKLKRSAGNKIN